MTVNTAAYKMHRHVDCNFRTLSLKFGSPRKNDDNRFTAILQLLGDISVKSRCRVKLGIMGRGRLELRIRGIGVG